MDIIKAIVLGVIEGITEFLPISSTGHLILANEFVGFGEEFTKLFDIVIQMGAIFAVVLIYWNRLVPGRQYSWPVSWKLWSRIVVAFLPMILIAGLFKDKIDELLFNSVVVACALIFWGVVLIILERHQFKARVSSILDLKYSTALFIGCFQCLALIPGTSRSAVTIIGAMILGLNRLPAVEFSFFLAIPSLSAASAWYLLKNGAALSGNELIVLAAGFLTSFLVAWVVIRFFLNFISRRDFQIFGYYRIVLGILVLVYFWVK